MSGDSKLYDFADFVATSPRSNRSSSAYLSDVSSFWEPSLNFTPATSPASSERRHARQSMTDTVVTLDLTVPVTLSFTKGNKLFRLKYSRIEIYKDSAGFINCIEANDLTALSSSFVHTFTSSKRPIPHLEQPASLTEKPLRISFLEQQTCQIAQTTFEAQPTYTFEKVSDCDRFQEAVLGVGVLFVAGVAEITSKGRGEEAISQNIRVCRSNSGTTTLLFFSNSQRKEKKRYHSIPLSAIDAVEPPRKAGKAVQLKLSQLDSLVAHFKSVNITFLSSSDAKRFCTLLQTQGVR